MNDTYIIPEVYDCETELPSDDDTSQLRDEEMRRKKEGKADDIIAMQAVVCLLIAAGIVIANIYCPDKAEALYKQICRLSADTSELFPNPVRLIMEYFRR